MLTVSQQQQVLNYLGWPGKTIVTGEMQYNGIIAGRFLNTTTDIDGMAVAFIGRIQTIDTQLQAALSRLTASQVGDIKVNADEIPNLRRERKRVLRELSNLLDIDMNLSTGNLNVLV